MMSIERTLTELADRDRPLRTAPLTSLTGLTGDERVELAERWPALPVDRRRQVIERLGNHAEDNVELDIDAVFIEALADADAEVRVGAVRGLWEHTERDVLAPLLDLVRDDPSPAVRAEAALALGRFVMLGEFEEARPRDVEQVTDTLRAVAADGAESEEVRARAVESLGASSQPWARDLIHDAYDSGSSRLMAAAVHAMGRSADTYWLPTVLDELTNDDAEMRYEAAAACGMIEDEDAVPALIELLDDPDIEVREQVISSLGEIGGEEAIEAIRGQVNAPDERIAEAARLALDQAEFGDDPLGFNA
jgi:HEAT repeat protein